MYALLRRLDVSVEIYSINEVVMSDHYIAFPSKGVVCILRSIIVICTVIYFCLVCLSTPDTCI